MSSAPPPPSGREPSLPVRPERPEGLGPPPPPPPPPPPAPPEGSAPRFVDPRPRPPRPDEETAWRPWMAPVALIGAFMAAVLGQLVIAAIGTLFGMDIADPTPAVNILATLFQDACFVGAAIVFAKAAGPVLPAQFGLRRTELGLGVAGVVLTMLAFYLLSGLWAQAIGIDETDTLPDSLGVEQSTVALIAVCVLVTVIAPLAEEVLFRGFFFGALRNWHGVWPAAVVTGVVFGGIHAGGTSAEYLPPLMLLGFLLCVLRAWTGSLLPCIVLHAINNSIAFAVNATDWNLWQGALLVIGANAACLLICWPFVRRADAQAERPASAVAT